MRRLPQARFESIRFPCNQFIARAGDAINKVYVF